MCLFEPCFWSGLTATHYDPSAKIVDGQWAFSLNRTQRKEKLRPSIIGSFGRV